MNDDSRLNEWFVPKFGPQRFRMFCGLLFLPYTGMCISFVVWGSLIAGSPNFERLAILVLIYFVALGIGAHVADNIGSKKIKPWGDVFNKRQSWLIILACMGFSYGLGLYYALLYAPLLIFIGIIEGFFLFAYNFELFKGLFHRNYWFALSWGMLPFMAGFVIQTNSITPICLFFSLIPFILSYIEIRISRLYKYNKRNNTKRSETYQLEILLKLLSIGTISLTFILLFAYAILL
ncbi:MAG: hypothetical protein L0H53_16345 [Candidatus Nitrosocosmicus sp.]|nr:hypothetical protein [Candidatus Nitrosocosmicus sp.]MDN5868957.1 hypothetical protein [Candidatus Nitrosocosmicus sp.]